MLFSREYYLIVFIIELITFPILLGLFITRFIKTMRHVLDRRIKISKLCCLSLGVFFTFYFSVFLYMLLSNIGRIEDIVFPVAFILLGLFGIYSELGRGGFVKGGKGT